MIAATIGMNTSIVTGKLSANARLNDVRVGFFDALARRLEALAHGRAHAARVEGALEIVVVDHDAEGLLFRRNGST